MVKKFFTMEFVKTDDGQVRIVVKILEKEIKEKIFKSIDETLSFLKEKFLEEVKRNEE